MKLFSKIKIVFSNLFFWIIGLFVGRSKKNIIFGSWGGNTFSDNSRYLYQYLYQNKEKYGLKNVIWITRNTEVNNLLNSNGYVSYLIGTKESKKWHLKSKIHVICNMSSSVSNFKADIDVKYSSGAKKVQLWHGVGVKSIGQASNSNKGRKNRAHSFLHNSFLKTIASEGCWFNEYLLCTSNLNKEINLKTIGCKYNHMFVSSYPRHCECLRLMDKEQLIIDKISSFKFAILYLPTFRSDDSQYVHPLDDRLFATFLKDNNIVFVQKPHKADNKLRIFNSNPNVINLDSNFDVNTLYRYVKCVISDYSSAAFDSIHLKIPTIFYTPDLDSFKHGDIGLLIDFESTFHPFLAKDVSSLTLLLNRILSDTYFDNSVLNIFLKTDLDYFNGIQKEYDDIWYDIQKAID